MLNLEKDDPMQAIYLAFDALPEAGFRPGFSQA